MHALSRTIGFALAATLIAGSASVAAQEVAPLVPKMEPVISPEITQRFQEALAAGLRTGGLEVSSPEAVRSKHSEGCAEADCAGQAQAALGAKRVATLEVRAVGKNYTLSACVFSGSTQLGTAMERCDICTVVEALQSAEKAAAAAAKAVATMPSEQPREEVPPPPKPQPKAAPTKAAATPAPPKKAAPGVTAKPKRQWPLWPALAAGGAGLVAIAIGVPLVAIDGTGTNCRGEARADYHNCEDLYDTAAGGWVMTAMGVGGLAASGVLFYLYLNGKPAEQPRTAGLEWLTASPLPTGGVAVGASGRF